ncbi:MAG: type VI secretion system ImpA family N-terminal domain-containing protein [Pirellulaceae bacterium]|nr:type VI secretion system ImpA family N-terminal domain-containing protein [Pirellulaceae bacterium]
MTSANLVNIESLLGGAESPEDAVRHRERQEIKDLFEEASGLIKEREDCDRNGGVDAAGQPWRSIPKPSWQRLIEKAQQYLTYSKDFQVAGWLASGLLGEHQIAGLDAGLELCLALAERYWEELLPPPSEDVGHLDTMKGVRTLLSKRSLVLLGDVVLVSGKPQGRTTVETYTYRDYKRSLELAAVDEAERDRRIRSGQVPLDLIQNVAKVCDPTVLDQLCQQASTTIATAEKLTKLLQSRCQPESNGDSTWPESREFLEELRGVSKALQSLYRVVAPDAPPESESESMPGQGTVVGSGQTLTRESALAKIEQIARFFENSEPHSPIHFALRQVVRWGRMPLDELLGELIESEDVLIAVQKRIGLPRNASVEEQKQ